MSDDISTRNLKKFDGNDFQEWKYQIKKLFIAKGVDDIVDGTRTMPAERNSAAAKEWRKEDAKAGYLISSSVETKKLKPLLICDTSKEMWDKLCMLHEQRSESNKMDMWRRYHEYKMPATESMEQHIASVQNMAAELIDAGETVTDKSVCAKLIGSLSSKFAVFTSIWDNVDPARQTLENLLERLVAEETRMKGGIGESASALAVSRRDQKKNSDGEKKDDTEKQKKKKRSKKNVECWKCHKKGHFASECGKKGGNDEAACDSAFGGEQRGGVEESERAKYANSPCESVRAVQEADQEDIWLTDSGASAHMTFRREWLDEYREDPQGGIVQLGDNEECEVMGRGTVSIKNFVNGVWQKSKIENVLLVPKLKKNLFSVGVCEEKG